MTSDNICGQRVQRGKGYQSLRREMLQDDRLSFKAQGILTYLLSLPDTWKTSSDRLGKLRPGKEGRDAIRSGLRELEEAGYLRRHRQRSSSGHLQWVWQYTEDPSDLLEQDVSAGRTMDGLSVDGSPDVGSPVDIEVLDVEIRDVEEPKDSAGAASPLRGDGPSDQHDDDPWAAHPGPLARLEAVTTTGGSYPAHWDDELAAVDAHEVRIDRLVSKLETEPQIDWLESYEETLARSMLSRGEAYPKVLNKILKDRRSYAC